jgi:crossover junction endodeoxyribonuclease RuvC
MGSKGTRHMWTEKLLNASDSFKTGDIVTVETLKNPRRSYVSTTSVVQEPQGVVLGVDASLRGTGIAIVDFAGTLPKLIFSTRITCAPRLSFFECIEKIFKEMSKILESCSIDSVAIEQTVYVQNYRISHILGAAKGAIIAAVTQKNIKITEYEPLRIKQAVVGAGRASKEQIRRTVCNILHIKPDISYDEGDAIAVAMCHAWTRKLTNVI